MIPGLRRSPGEGKGYPLQHSGLENPMEYTVHGVAESQTRLNDFHFHLRDDIDAIDLTNFEDYMSLCMLNAHNLCPININHDNREL